MGREGGRERDRAGQEGDVQFLEQLGRYCSF